MRIHRAALLIAAVAVLGSHPAAWGQTQTQGQSQSTSSSRSSSGTSSGQTVGQGFGPSSVIQDSAAGRTFSGFSGVLGGFESPDRESIGAGTQDVRNAMQAMGADIGAAQGTGSRRSAQQRTGASSFNRAGTSRSGSRSTQTEIRATLRLGFKLNSPARAQLGSTLAARLEKSTRIQTRSPLEVSFQDGTAILRGVVATEHDRVLAGRLAQLEPGVRRVENELTVHLPVAEPVSRPATQ